MHADVVIATRGRAKEVRRLIDLLDGQSMPLRSIVIVGVSDADLPDVSDRAAGPSDILRCVLSPRAGLPAQRNHGLDRLSASHALDGGSAVIFFDDDFRPARDWAETCCAFLSANPNVHGVTGSVLADGAKGATIGEDMADRLNGAPDTAAPATPVRLRADGLYGCNMAIRGSAFATCRFDENLPLYGWLEDADISGQIRRRGNTLLKLPELRGVHLGSKGARVSGLQYGYSQVANPIYLMRKGTFPRTRTMRFVLQAILGNYLKSRKEHPIFDYRGRLQGNLRAFRDLAASRMRPDNILGMR